MNNIWKYFLTLIVGIMIGFFIGNNNVEIKEVPITIHDTILVDSIRIVEHTKIEFIRDTIIKVDTVINRQDGTYVELPMLYKVYNDVFVTDSSYLSLKIKHHGISSQIDNIEYTYKYTPTFKCPLEKKLRPFVGFLGGPSLNAGFREVNGVSLQILGGVVFKNGFGGMASYEIDGINLLLSHEIKIGFLYQW